MKIKLYKSNFIFIFYYIIIFIVNFNFNSCGSPIIISSSEAESYVDVIPKKFEIPPSLYPDSEYFHEQLYTTNILFDFSTDFEKTNLSLSNDEWKDVLFKFRIEVSNLFDSDNHNYLGYNAEVRYFDNYKYISIITQVPVRVGKLNLYSKSFEYGETGFYVTYTSSDISGVYRIIAEVWYKETNLFKKESIAIVKIPNLVEIPDESYGEDEINGERVQFIYWKRVGQTKFHSKNNYLQEGAVKYAWGYFATYYVKKHYKVYGENFTIKMNDCSLPWGGLFWIGEIKDFTSMYNILDGEGKLYDITWRGGLDNRIFATPHKTHRDGRNVDIGITSYYGGYAIEKEIIQEFYEDHSNVFFKDEGNHYHLEFKNGNEYIKNYYVQ